MVLVWFADVTNVTKLFKYPDTTSTNYQAETHYTETYAILSSIWPQTTGRNKSINTVVGVRSQGN